MDKLRILNLPDELLRVFTLEEERNSPFRDIHDKDRYYNSSNRNVLQPIVSNYIYSKGFRPQYPDNKKIAVCLTHDIDVLFSTNTYRHLLKDIFLKENKGEALTDLFLKKRRYLRQYAVEKLIKIEKRFNARASYYFLAIDEEEIDYNYSLAEIKHLLQLVVHSGSEVGLHGGFERTYLSSKKMGMEKGRLEEALGFSVKGYRNQALRFRNPDTLVYLQENNFLYDTTLGYCDMIGFRNGMCYPFMPFNAGTMEFLDIIEIPLVVMDVSFWKYMNVDFKTAFLLCRRLIDEVEKINGVFTLLWHNTYLSGKELELYESILKYCFEKNAWIDSAENILKWWKENKFDEKLLEYFVK